MIISIRVQSKCKKYRLLRNNYCEIANYKQIQLTGFGPAGKAIGEGIYCNALYTKSIAIL